MARKKKAENWLDQQAEELTEAFSDKVIKETWPKVTIGSHSTRTEYEDGRVEFVTDWDALQRDVREAIADYERQKLVEEAPYHPGYEGAIIKEVKPAVKAKSARKKKEQ
jgi:uncharacterized protein YchJ